MIKAFQKDEVFLADVQKNRARSGGFHLWWLGQSGYLVQWQGRHILIDPYLSDSLTHKYANTEKPHVRMSEKVIDPEKLDFIDLVSSSHNHTDHLDGATLIPLIRQNPHLKLIIPEANRAFVANRIKQPADFAIGLNEGQSVDIPFGLHIHGIPAAHNELERDEEGRCKFMGYVFQFGEFSLYHSGDTLWHDAIPKALAKFNIDIAILPINGNKPERKVAGNLNAEEAIRLARTIKASLLIPCHYHLFEFNTVDPDEFMEKAKVAGQAFQVLAIGEGMRYA